jgi:hypothetical protein
LNSVGLLGSTFSHYLLPLIHSPGLTRLQIWSEFLDDMLLFPNLWLYEFFLYGKLSIKEIIESFCLWKEIIIHYSTYLILVKKTLPFLTIIPHIKLFYHKIIKEVLNGNKINY